MAKSKLRLEARNRRVNGESIKTIARDLNVSTSTASLWCRDIQLSENQIKQLEKNTRDPFYGRRLTYALKQQAVRKLKEVEIRKKAWNLVGKLNERDFFIAGIALYWAEGFKKDKMLGFSNTDPKMIMFFLKWIKNCMKIENSFIKMRVVLNESHKYRINDIQDHWSNLTTIPLSNFYKPTYQKVIWKKEYENPENYFGVLRIRILKSTDLLKKVMGLIDGLANQPTQ